MNSNNLPTPPSPTHSQLTAPIAAKVPANPTADYPSLLGLGKAGRHWVGFGSVISILCGLSAGLIFKDLTLGILLSVIGEAISLTLALLNRLNEIETSLYARLREQAQVFSLLTRVAESSDPHLRRRFDALRHELRELADGRFVLRTLDDVYEDDKLTIRALHRHDILRSTCPVRGTKDDARDQFTNKAFLGSVEAHMEAAQRGVVVARIFSFETRELSQLSLIQDHLKQLHKSGVECYCVYPNEREFSQARQVRTDFVVAGESRVSVGVLNAKGEVSGAEVNYNDDYVKYYIDQFRILVDLAERHTALSRSEAPNSDAEIR